MKWMHTVSAIAVASGALAACQDNSGSDTVEKHASFLKECLWSEDCEGLICVRGVCTDGCESDTDCHDGDVPGTCVHGSDGECAQSCATNSAPDAVCLPKCDDREDCRKSRVCDQGACVPDVGAPCLPVMSCEPDAGTCAWGGMPPGYVSTDFERFFETNGPHCPGACMVAYLEGDLSPICEGETCADPEEIERRVYCTCRCDAPEGYTGELCTCPEDFTCVEGFDLGGPDIEGSYCMRDGTWEKRHR